MPTVDQQPPTILPAELAGVGSLELQESDRVLAEFLGFIGHRRYVAYERIASERELAERFKVGRGVIREVLSKLEGMRVIERRRNSGIYLANVEAEGSIDALVLSTAAGLPVSVEDVRQLSEMRMLIEVQAAGIACQRRDDADIAKLDAILTRSEALLTVGQSLADIDPEFHLQMIACSKNKFLRRVAHSFYLVSRERRCAYFLSPEQCRKSHAQHMKLRDALVSRDYEHMTVLLQSHLRGVESYLLDRLKLLEIVDKGDKSHD